MRHLRLASIVLLAFLLLSSPALADGVYLPLTIGGAGDLPTPTATPDGMRAYVTYIVDGDTIDVDIAGSTYRVRYIGIDTPESGDCYYTEAKEKNRELVYLQTVRLVKDVSEVDHFGRLLRYVYVGDLHVNAAMVAQGYALASTYPPDVAHSLEFADLQRQAREANLGLWAGCATATPTSSSTVTAIATLTCTPIPTATWTPTATVSPTPTPTVTSSPRPTPTPTPTEATGSMVYITDTGTKYHRDGCRYLDESKHAVTCSWAKSHGYTPCSVCDPVCP